MSSIFIHEFHELLYILGSGLLFFIAIPKAVVTAMHRKLLYLAVLALFSCCYLGIEFIDPWVFALHLMPISIMLASLFEGALAGIATWGTVVSCGILIVGTDWAASLIGSTVLLLLSLTFHYRSLDRSTLGFIMLNGLFFVAVYMILYIAIAAFNGPEIEPSVIGTILLGALPSTALVTFTFYRVRNQERLQEELNNAEKYQMIGQLAASISHEVRNPLTMTSGFLQMMGKPSLDAATLERYRQHAIEGIENATSIITDYLNYAKPSIEEARPLDVKAEIEALVPWISSLAVMAGIVIQIKHHDEAPIFMLGEPKKFQQCLLNIMKNAIEAMPGGGKLTVMTKSDNEQVCITIADTGVGMSKLQLKRIGMPFFTTKEKGTGLGLMVVVSLIKAMGGQIAFNSKRGHGTVCEIRYRICNV